MQNERTISTELPLYEKQPYTKAFHALVTSCAREGERYAVTLSQTAFFPEGGGQYADKGRIGDAKVQDVRHMNEQIIHYVDSCLPVGEQVECELDWEDRYRKMQNHSAEHLLCGLIHNRFGYENVGFHLSDENVTLDVNGPLTKEELSELELEANRIISLNLPILVTYPDEEELDRLDYRSKLELSEGVRLVEIQGIDLCACCAPHVRSTAEIGVLKILDAMPHRGGMRITMIAGFAAYLDYQRIAENNKEIVGITSAKRYETALKVASLDKKSKDLASENTELKKKITALTAQSIRKELASRMPGDTSVFVFFPEGLDDVQVRTLVNEMTEAYEGLVAAFYSTSDAGGDKAKEGFRFIISSAKGDENLPTLTKEMCAKLGGRGGGSPKMVQGSVLSREDAIRSFFGC